MIVITGATGKLGHEAVEQQLKKVPAKQLAVAVRDPVKAADFAAGGVEVRHVDYDKPETLVPALRGGERLLFISSSEVGNRRAAQHTDVIEGATKAGISLIAYTSILRADTSRLALAGEHRVTEQMIRASGIPFVILRNGWYLENYTENLAGVLARGAFSGSAGSGRIAAAARADYAAAAADVLTGSGQENQVYELAGDVPFTMTQLAAEVAAQSGKPVAYDDLPAQQYKAVLLGSGMPPPIADLYVDADLGIARGELDAQSGDLRRLIGRPTTSLAAAVHAALARLTAASLAAPEAA